MTFSFQPDVSQYCADLMPMLLNYLSSLSQAKIGHVTKAFYALENFMENLGKIIDAVLNECWGGQKTKTILQVNH